MWDQEFVCCYIKIMNPKSYTNCLYGNPSVGTSELNVWLCNILKYRFICLSSVLTNTKFYHDKKLLEDFQALLLPWGLVFLLKKKVNTQFQPLPGVSSIKKKASEDSLYVTVGWNLQLEYIYSENSIVFSTGRTLRDLMRLS